MQDIVEMLLGHSQWEFHDTPTHSYFRNSVEEFHPHETLYALIKLLSSLSSLIWCPSILNVYKTMMKHY